MKAPNYLANERVQAIVEIHPCLSLERRVTPAGTLTDTFIQSGLITVDIFRTTYAFKAFEIDPLSAKTAFAGSCVITLNPSLPLSPTRNFLTEFTFNSMSTLQRALSRSREAGAKTPRVMAISVHPYLSGVPHRIGYLEQLYDYVLGHEDVLVWTGEQILDWFLAQQREAK
jgi:hypothetical protein